MRNKLMALIGAHAASDPDVLFMTGDLGFSVVEPLQASIGPRFINAGVAEANMMTMAGGLAACGFLPYVYTIAPFVTARCYEQIRNDICYPRRRVRLVGVGAGLSYGSLGASHHSLEDAAILATLPNMIIASPGNEAELGLMHEMLIAEERAVYLRVPRENGTAYVVPERVTPGEAAYEVRAGSDIAFVASGPSVNECLAAAMELSEAGVSARVISVPLLHPFPMVPVADLVGSQPVVSVFEGYVGGPLELGMLRLLATNGRGNRHLHVAVNLAYPERCGSTEFLRAALGIDAKSIIAAARRLLDGRG